MMSNDRMVEGITTQFSLKSKFSEGWPHKVDCRVVYRYKENLEVLTRKDLKFLGPLASV